MLKYLVLFLISLTCLASDPKFHFMDCVKISRGFYKGCKGNVTSYYLSADANKPVYGVDITNCRGETFSSDFEEEQLEGCKK